MKRILIAILALVLTISFVSCNAKSGDISNASAIDIATSVNEALTFVDYMLELDDSIATNFYALPDGVVEMKVYVSSSGATAEASFCKSFARPVTRNISLNISRQLLLEGPSVPMATFTPLSRNLPMGAIPLASLVLEPGLVTA